MRAHILDLTIVKILAAKKKRSRGRDCSCSSPRKSERSSPWLERRASRLHTSSSTAALYHVVERDRHLASVYAAFIKERFPGVRLIVSPRGELIGAARHRGVQVWGELFSDRAYTPRVSWCRAVSRVRFSPTGGDQGADGNISSKRRGLHHEGNITGARCPDDLCSRRFSQCFAHRTFAGITLPCGRLILARLARG